MKLGNLVGALVAIAVGTTVLRSVSSGVKFAKPYVSRLDRLKKTNPEQYCIEKMKPLHNF